MVADHVFVVVVDILVADSASRPLDVLFLVLRLREGEVQREVLLLNRHHRVLMVQTVVQVLMMVVVVMALQPLVVQLEVLVQLQLL